MRDLLLAELKDKAELVDVTGDGNCLLHALALVFDDRRSPADIREATCACVRDHWNELGWAPTSQPQQLSPPGTNSTARTSRGLA